MAANRVDLTDIFQTVTRTLMENQQALDQEDSYNHDHGTNMVQTFDTISRALEKKQGSSDSAKLAYAAKTLAKQSHSGSAQLYAQNLSQASQQFKRKKVNEQNALQLLQTMIGGQGGPASAAGGADMLGALLGGQASPQPAQTGGSGLLGALLGGLGGQADGSTGGQNPGRLDMQDLLSAGMAFMQARQQGQGNLQALAQALAAGSGMGTSAHRNQSTQLVAESFLNALSQKRAAA